MNKNYKFKTVSTFLLEFSAHWVLTHLLKENLYCLFYITCELFILLAFKLNLTMFHLNWKGMLNSRLRHYYWRWLHDFLVPSFPLLNSFVFNFVYKILLVIIISFMYHVPKDQYTKPQCIGVSSFLYFSTRKMELYEGNNAIGSY